MSNGRATARVKIVELTKLMRGKQPLLFFLYHHTHNTVVRNADDLIEEFWRKDTHKPPPLPQPSPITSTTVNLA
jgi:hypothetical protein